MQEREIVENMRTEDPSAGNIDGPREGRQAGDGPGGLDGIRGMLDGAAPFDSVWSSAA